MEQNEIVALTQSVNEIAALHKKLVRNFAITMALCTASILMSATVLYMVIVH